ncbi:MAG: hypothetical protein NC043_06880 [Muribaculaceae bacterium]|nr:hypothetical protein [Muribaculaceae bacterium]
MIHDGNLDEAIDALDAIIAENDSDAEALFLRGKALWRKGCRSRATSDYAASAAIDPDGPATLALDHARDIEAFFNPDLLNP